MTRALLAMLLAGAAARPPARTPPAEAFLYIPPDLADRVRLYHSFSLGPARPEINELRAKVVADAKGWADGGLTGKGYRIAQPGSAKRGPEMRDLAIPLSRPVTVSLWWRLDAPMKADSNFALAALHADSGYISNFVRGKSQWCALQRPTFVIQVYRFGGISNVNGIHFGDAWVADGVWHHAAVTVSAASQVSVYWDGRPRCGFPVKGRFFSAADVVKTIALGSSWLAHPMTIDEVLVLDCAMTADQIAAYVTAVGKLVEIGFPFRSSAAGRQGDASSRPGAGLLRRLPPCATHKRPGLPKDGQAEPLEGATQFPRRSV